ncbi:MAG: trimeric intracellular cation channel family protein [Magnetospirillum sp. WYHS-4]
MEPAVPQSFLAFFELTGVAVFAITGALVAARKEMDPFGFVVVGTATGIGGGTLRDLLLDQPVFWIVDSRYLVAGAVAALSTFWLARFFHSRWSLLLWADALGLALFAVTGTQKAVAVGASPLIAVLMGVMSASFGGLIRDLLCSEPPLFFHKEIYPSAAAVGSLVYLMLGSMEPPAGLSEAAGFLAAFLVRAAAIRWSLSFPRYTGTPKPPPSAG